MSEIKPPCHDRWLRVAEVSDLTALPRKTIYNWSKEGKLPPPISLHGRVVVWRESDIRTWMADMETAHASREAGVT